MWYPARDLGGGSWAVTVLAGDHGCDDGTYYAHAYATCGNGIYSFAGGASFDIELRNYLFVTGAQSSGYRSFYLKNPDSGMAPRLAVWSDADGQDDLTWIDFAYYGDGLFSVTLDCYALRDSGACQAHAYDGSLFLRAISFTTSIGDVDESRLFDQIGGSGLQVLNTTLPGDASSRLWSAINVFTSRGYRVGFMMIDLRTGKGIAYNSDSVFYSASTIKGPYVVSFMSAYGSAGGNAGLTSNCIINSDNTAYTTLRRIYGSGVFRDYLSRAGINTGYASSNYAWYTCRDLAKMWYENYKYFRSGANGSSWTRSLFAQSYNSGIGNALRGSCEVTSKPGWMPGGSYSATNDGGIVWCNSGPYILTIMSTAPSDFGLVSQLASAVDYAHSSVVG